MYVRNTAMRPNNKRMESENTEALATDSWLAENEQMCFLDVVGM